MVIGANTTGTYLLVAALPGEIILARPENIIPVGDIAQWPGIAYSCLFILVVGTAPASDWRVNGSRS
jgi:hypothetical protein